MAADITIARTGRERTQAGTVPGTDALQVRIAEIRAEVFELVDALQMRQAAMPPRELDGAGDRMQSIANQLGAVQVLLASRPHS